MSLTQTEFDAIIDKAERNCIESGGKLTAKRKHVLTTLVHAKKALSAYEIADLYKESMGETIPAMSVYRMLNFLIEEHLVHKLLLTNKYIACAHINCNHEHDIPQFLICDGCDNIREVAVKKDVIHTLQRAAEGAEFALDSPQFELHGLCKSCQSN